MASKLNFREKGLSPRAKKRIAILSGIFVAFLIIFQITLNKNISKKEVYMADATLPLVTIEAYGNTMAELHGYTNEMEACYMRDVLIPLDDKRKMDLTIKNYGFKVDKASYEIRSLDTSRKIADTTLTEWDKSKDEMSTSVQVSNLVDPETEYLFILTLEGQGSKLHYYTRVMLPGEDHTTECLDFAKNFHDTALSPNYTDLASYVEPSPFADTDTLADVNIQSTLEQIGWKGFEGHIVGTPLVQITDMNTDYMSVLYSYLIQGKETDIPTYYNVEEYFKIRYTAEQIYLLDYQRNMEQLLDSSSVTAKGNVLTTGIAMKNKEYLSNETGSVVAFVQGGELFEYNQTKGSFTKVFGFIQDPTDRRQNYQQHNIRILNMDETGSMDFVVYGYMNHGAHEGDCGINLYHYDSAKQESVEQVFISSTHSYQVLNANFSNLLYENLKGEFYIMLGGTLAKVGLDNLATEELISGLSTGQYAVSSSGQYVCWITDDEVSDTISVMDLETEKIRKIKAPSGSKVKPLAFMTNDFVYGIVNEKDIIRDTAGSKIYPMSTLRIVDTSSTKFDVLKTYQKPGYYVTEVSKESYTLHLDRVTKTNDGYTPSDSDTIKDSAEEQNKTVTIAKEIHKKKGSLTTFVMADNNTDKALQSSNASLAVTKQTREMSVSTKKEAHTYFVYVGNRVTLTTQNLSKAITTADEQMGLVIDNEQRYVWKRGKKTYVNAFQDIEVGKNDSNSNTSAGCLSAMLARKGVEMEIHPLLARAESPLSILQKALPKSLVLDLSGCNLNQILYYVSQDSPVYAGTGPNAAYLIIGYDATSIVVYHSETDTYARMSKDSAEKLFEEKGNVFISYVE